MARTRVVSVFWEDETNPGSYISPAKTINGLPITHSMHFGLWLGRQSDFYSRRVTNSEIFFHSGQFHHYFRNCNASYLSDFWFFDISGNFYISGHFYISGNFDIVSADLVASAFSLTSVQLNAFSMNSSSGSKATASSLEPKLSPTIPASSLRTSPPPPTAVDWLMRQMWRQSSSPSRRGGRLDYSRSHLSWP